MDEIRNKDMQRDITIADEGYDHLTGLPDMNHFFEIAESVRERLISEGNKLALVFFDFNGMKSFNMRYGFAEGDKLIRTMGELLADEFGRDNCGRFGGDRFAVVGSEMGLEDRIKRVFAKCRSMNGGKTLPVRAGIYQDRMGKVGCGAACDRAKMACDRNRGSVVSTYTFFDEGMLEEASKREYIIENIDRAIKEGWIQVYYQPIIRSTNGRVSDEEALSRWIDPVRGFMSPAEFIPVLEEAKLIYKLDLYVLEKLLEKHRILKERGLFVVPASVNISRADFESCDIVEEIRKRVDETAFGRDLVTIEITESTLGADFDYMKTQVERLRGLGFKVWMDDYGSGYSSPTLLKKLHFDTIKLDMGFLEDFGKGDESKIILSSLVKMAIGLGMDTVVEGVETPEQAEFLKEIGCTKLQGYHFCKPIPLENILERYEKGTQVGFEDPEQRGYYAAIGKFTLYELSMSAEGEGALDNYFNTMPMAIVELKHDLFSILRCNDSYKSFFSSNISGIQYSMDVKTEGIDATFVNAVRKCATDGEQTLMDMRLKNGKKIHLLLRRVAINPVTDARSVVVVVLGMTETPKGYVGLTYDNVAKALSADYIYLYHVNVANDRFVEYTPDLEHGDITIERRGGDFFNASRSDVVNSVYEADRARFTEVFTKENVLRAIDEHGAFTHTYRLLLDGKPVYVDMKAIRIGSEGSHIIIGVNNVDAQMRAQADMEKLREESVVYARLAALSGEYICFFTIDPETWAYMEYSANSEFDALGAPKVGTDFFKDARKSGSKVVFAEDRELFARSFTRAKVMKAIAKNGIFSLTYRIVFEKGTRYVCLKAAIVTENEKKLLILGVTDVDEQVRRDQEYALNLSMARSKANIDELTGVKNKHAYIDAEKHINQMIVEGNVTPFALVMLDLYRLREINDAKGHIAGDEFLKQGCKIICDVFQHSPVYRIGGDEFVVIVTGRDYDQIDVLMDLLRKKNNANRARGGIVIAGGVARYNNDSSMEALFKRADEIMYRNKEELDALGPE